ncbi:MAG: RDD family protein [Halanaerobiaceae bacterium]
MKSIKLTTPENIEIEYNLADLGSRTAAVVIDMLIQGVIFFLLGLAIYILSVYNPWIWDEYYGWVIGISLILYAVIFYGYFIVMELNMNGMTPGKKVLKIRTIRNNGQPITLKHSAIRNLFRPFIDMLGIGPILIFFSKNHKRIGDYAASTIVIIEKSNNRPISLENLQISDSLLDYELEKDELQLLKEYLNRKNNIDNYYALKENIIHYFIDKYKDQELPEEVKNIIAKL